MAKIKYLIETSAVPAALGDTPPPHIRHFQEEVEGGKLYTSVYIRMEFIRRWFCDAARSALTIFQCDDVPSALTVLQQDFSPRNVKGVLAALSRWMRETGAVRNTRGAAEEVASVAMNWLWHFDRVFPSRINNLCKCQIGSMAPDVDFNHLLDDLHAFYESFCKPVMNCEVNAFLEFGRARGRSSTLLQDDRVSKLPVGENLAELAADSTWITCKECSRIGDVVIALEQSSAWCLVHLDKAFNELCRVRDRRHKLIKSISAIMKESPPSV